MLFRSAAKYADVAEKLDERAALPDYMLDQIKDAAQNGVSAKEYLEAQIAGELHDLHDIVHQQIAALATDSSTTTADYLTVLSGLQHPVYRYEYINLLLTDGQTAAAQTALDALSNDATAIPEKEAGVYAHQKDLTALSIAVASTGRNLNQLTKEEVTQLRGIAGNENFAASAARAIVQHIDGGKTTYREPVYLPTPNTQRKPARTRLLQAAAANSLTASPNPAQNYITLSYQLAELPANARLTVTDMQGRTVWEQALKTATDQCVIDLSSWQSGIYTCRIVDAKNATLATQKVSVAR